MMRIVTVNGDVKVCLQVLGERPKNMPNHVGWQIANPVGRKISLEIEIVSAAQIQRHGHKRFIHRQAEAVTTYAPFVAQRRAKRDTKSNGAILDGMVRVDMKITITFEL